VPALARALTSDPSPLVRGHAAWALGRLGGRAALDRARRRETDPGVREEVDCALAGGEGCSDVPAQQPLADWLAGRKWAAVVDDPTIED
jgi:hypothetical protein